MRPPAKVACPPTRHRLAGHLEEAALGQVRAGNKIELVPHGSVPAAQSQQLVPCTRDEVRQTCVRRPPQRAPPIRVRSAQGPRRVMLTAKAFSWSWKWPHAMESPGVPLPGPRPAQLPSTMTTLTRRGAGADFWNDLRRVWKAMRSSHTIFECCGARHGSGGESSVLDRSDTSAHAAP